MYNQANKCKSATDILHLQTIQTNSIYQDKTTGQPNTQAHGPFEHSNHSNFFVFKKILTNHNAVPRGKLGYVIGSVKFKCVCQWFFNPQNRDFSAKFNSAPPVRYLAFFRNFLIRLRVRVYILWFAYAPNLDLTTTYFNINVKKSGTSPLQFWNSGTVRS